MVNTSIQRRYNLFFIMAILCFILYVMWQSLSNGGITNFQENFYKKAFLIEQVNLLRIKMGDRVFPVALLGKDGWTHYTGDGELNYFQNSKVIDIDELTKKLTTLNLYLKSQGTTLFVVIAPNKSTIYPDKLPEQIVPLSKQSWLDSLISKSEDDNLPTIVDLRPALRAARQENDVFYKTDTHWNGYGAFAAYTTIINALRSSYPELRPYETSELELVTRGPDIRDTPELMGISTITELSFFYLPKEPFVITIYPSNYFGYDQSSWIPDSDLPTLLMFHDSQGATYLNSYLSMNFGKSDFVHFQATTKFLTKESIQYFKPDIIIIEIVERGLQSLSYQLNHWVEP